MYGLAVWFIPVVTFFFVTLVPIIEEQNTCTCTCQFEFYLCFQMCQHSCVLGYWISTTARKCCGCTFISLFFNHIHIMCTELAALTHRDDEYAWAGVKDPKIVVTTSHNPSSRLKQFAKVKRLVYSVCVSLCVWVCVWVCVWGGGCGWVGVGKSVGVWGWVSLWGYEVGCTCICWLLPSNIFL